MKYSDESIENVEKLEKEKDGEEKKKKVLIVIIILLLLSILVLLFRLGRLANLFMGHIIETIVLSPEQKDDLPIDLCGRVFYSDDTPAAGYDIELHSNVQYDITDEDGDFYFSNAGYGSHQLILREEDGSEKVAANFSLERNSEITNGNQLISMHADGTWRFVVPTETLVVEFDLELNEKGNRLKVIPESTCALMEESWVYTFFGNAQASSVGPILTPHGTLMLPDGTIHFHLGGARLPDGTMVNAEGSITQSGEQKKKSDLPDGYKLDSRDLILTLPDGTRIHLKDQKTALPDGVLTNGQTAIATYPDGTIVDNHNAIIITPGGYVIDENGNITDPDGRPFTGSRLPDGTRINGDGTITTPDGSIIRKPQDHHGYIIDDGSTGWPGRPIGEVGDYGKPEPVPGNWANENGYIVNYPGTPGRPGEDTPEGPGNTSGTHDGTIPPFPGGDTPKKPSNNDPGDSGDDGPRDPGGSSSGGGGGTTEPQTDFLDVVDTETDKIWRQLTTIDLFKDGGLIYPGASASYDFYIRNGVRGPVRYKMTITEAEHEVGAVPLEYRLKDSTGYIAGTSDNAEGWLTAAELEAVWVTLANKGNNHYTLEWRWPYERGDSTAEIADGDAYDTALANANNREHYIYVKIYAESIQ